MFLIIKNFLMLSSSLFFLKNKIKILATLLFVENSWSNNAHLKRDWAKILHVLEFWSPESLILFLPSCRCSPEVRLLFQNLQPVTCIWRLKDAIQNERKINLSSEFGLPHSEWLFLLHPFTNKFYNFIFNSWLPFNCVKVPHSHCPLANW